MLFLYTIKLTRLHYNLPIKSLWGNCSTGPVSSVVTVWNFEYWGQQVDPLSTLTFMEIYGHFKEKGFLAPRSHLLCLKTPLALILTVTHDYTVWILQAGNFPLASKNPLGAHNSPHIMQPHGTKGPSSTALYLISTNVLHLTWTKVSDHQMSPSTFSALGELCECGFWGDKTFGLNNPTCDLDLVW